MKNLENSELKYMVSRGLHLPPFIIDFSRLQLPSVVSMGMRRALEAEMGHTAVTTQAKCFSALEEFSKFLYDEGIALVVPLPANVVYRFADWLDQSSRGLSAQPYLRNVIRILQWCMRNAEGVVSPKTTFLVRTIREQKIGMARASLGESEIKRILDACYENIEEIERQRFAVKRIMSGETETEWEDGLFELLSELLILGNGTLPTQYVVNRSGRSFARRVEEFGGHGFLGKFLWLSPYEVLPFYLAILIQTSANPRALLTMTRTPFVTHPLRSDLERLSWMKWRAKTQQYADFPSGRAWSSPSLVRRLTALNDELVSGCRSEDKERLFISYQSKHRYIRIASPSTWSVALSNFIEHKGLPEFDFRDVRRAGAQLIRGISGSDQQPQQRLNHRSQETTRIYTGTQQLADEFDQTISGHQTKLLESSIKSVREESLIHAEPSDPLNKPAESAETVFGFRCKDPLSGLAPGSIKGKACLQFFRCAVCPGALIPLDDFEIVATLLASSIALEEARCRSLAEGWWPRYELLYEPTRNILATELIPSIHAAVMTRAKVLVSKRFIPYLE